MTEQQFYLAIRQALLALVDAIERWRGIEPRTAVLKSEAKAARKERRE